MENREALVKSLKQNNLEMSAELRRSLVYQRRITEKNIGYI